MRYVINKIKFDFSNDRVSMLDQKFNIAFTSKGHYALPISKTTQLVKDLDRNNQVGQVYLTICELKRKLKVANQLHSQFGNANP